MTGMLPQGLKKKVEQCRDRGDSTNNLGFVITWIGRSIGSGGNNQSQGGNVKQDAIQLLHEFLSNQNT
jgi:hypothetical protein